MELAILCLLLQLLPAMSLSPSSSVVQPPPVYNIRRYQPSDNQGIKDLFATNIQEEWGEVYHEGRYLSNAQRYIDSVVNDDATDSDLNNVERTYFCNGGYFWVLTCTSSTISEKRYADDDTTEEEKEEEIIIGTCGLQRISNTEAELRRVCISKSHRSNGWGSQLVQLAMDRVKTHEEMKNVAKVIVSTIEHSVDGIDFYKTKHDFVDTIDECTRLPKIIKGVHGTPIDEKGCGEVFMEYKIRR